MHGNVTLSSTKFGPEAFFFLDQVDTLIFSLGCSVVALTVLQLFAGAIKDVDDG